MRLSMNLGLTSVRKDDHLIKLCLPFELKRGSSKLLLLELLPGWGMKVMNC